MSLKLWEFTVKNMRTKESTSFLGQGATMAEAWKDGYGNLGVKIAGNPLSLAVILPNGRIANRSHSEFESDIEIQISYLQSVK